MKDMLPLNPQEVNTWIGQSKNNSGTIENSSSSANGIRIADLSPETVSAFPENVDMDKFLNELKQYNSQLQYYDKEIRLHVNKDINQVIVTVINKNTNEVIYEYPYKELQKLAEYLKDMTGFLVDKEA